MLTKFWSNVKFMRMRKGYKQKEFAKKVELSAPHYCQLEGHRLPNVSFVAVLAIAEELGCSVDALLNNDWREDESD